jgi:hypothetical protein
VPCWHIQYPLQHESADGQTIMSVVHELPTRSGDTHPASGLLVDAEQPATATSAPTKTATLRRMRDEADIVLMPLMPLLERFPGSCHRPSSPCPLRGPQSMER